MKRAILAVMNVAPMLMVSTAVYAQEVVVRSRSVGNLTIYLALAAAFTITVAAVGGALAQGRTAQSALEGIARNPEAAGKIMTPMIIALALIESLVIYALVITFLLQAKI